MSCRHHITFAFGVICGVLLFSCGTVLAQEQKHDQQQLRDWFERAEQIAHRPNSSEFHLLKKRLQDYPLWPYVSYKTLLKFPYLSNENAIARFLKNYANTPMDRPLRRKWLKHLVRQKRSELFIKYYADVNDTGLYCHYLRYQVDKNGLSPYLSQIQELWVVGKSQPNECDPLFKKWKDRGNRTIELVYQRIALAANGGSSTLIPYLKRLLPEQEQYLADLWLSVRRSPSLLTRHSKFHGVKPKIESEILTYGLKRLIWRNEDLALKTWAKYKKAFSFSAEQKHQITERFAIALASKNHPQASVWLQRASSNATNPDVMRWHLTEVLRVEDWHHALQVLRSAPATEADDLSFKYWEARALEFLGNQQVAGAMMQEIAQNRHYYGFMASGKMHQGVNLQDQPFQISNKILDNLMAKPAMQRIEEFVQLGRKTSARREWNMLFPSLPQEQQQLAAMLASKWLWHDQAIHAFSQAGYLDDVSRRFPLAYKQDLISSSKRNQINPAWAFAIARRESSFKSDARSGAGAYGLMQVLPSTAQYLLKQKIPARKLFNAKYNVDMGTQYLNYLMNKMGSNTVLATASYNAGWRRVRNWVPKDSKIPADIWIETIPFKETRNYVKAVLAYKQIYHHLLGEKQNYFEQYANMKIGKGS